MPLVMIHITRGRTTHEQNAALIKGATDLPHGVLNNPRPTFAVMQEAEQEVEKDDRRANWFPAAEHRRLAQNRLR
jgi:phenylpyruvate tautomerase PptA (4-oxalocrotonate tautomerase family)